MYTKEVCLSKRLTTLCHMITPGNRVCDVGCDHGFVPIYLITHGLAKECLAMDVGEGPLTQGKLHVEQYGLEQQIQLRLSDGLQKFQIGEADTLIIAGMGGPLMMRILKAYPEKTAAFQELILQPQSEIMEFRNFLREEGYRIVAEEMVQEDGKFYPMMKVQKGIRKETPFLSDIEKELEDCYGPILLQSRHPVLLEFLEKEEKTLGAILERLQGDERNVKRYHEIELQYHKNQAAKRRF